MAGRTPWAAIRDSKGPLSPAEAARGAAIGRAMAEAARLGRAQEAGQTRVEIADPAGLDLATLRDYVALLGGRLVLTAVFPEAPAAPALAEGREVGARRG